MAKATGIYKKVEAWCEQAVSLLEKAGLSPKLGDLTRQAIKRHSGTPAVHEIAADLAEGLNDLPASARTIANDELVQRFGFGYEVYTQAKLKRAMKILARGRIKNDDEFRELTAIASDTTINSELVSVIGAMLVKYEVDR